MLSKTPRSCRFIYNHYLGKKIDLYKCEGKSIMFSMWLLKCRSKGLKHKGRGMFKSHSKHHRDINANENILKQGLKELTILVS